MYDNTCKYLAETFSSDFASWLLGEAIALTKLEPSELSVEPIRADSVIFLESSQIILHIEFQTRADENMAFRMLDYWVRLHRKYPNKKIHQSIIYLKPTDSELVYETSFMAEQTSHNFNVIRLWEQSTEIFRQYLGLLPLAVLTKDDPIETLKTVAKQLETISDKRIQSNVTTATYIISGLALEKEIIQRLLRREIMKESVTYQEILLEGKAEGKAEGEAKGLAKGLVEGEIKAANQIALNMLHSGISMDLIAQFTGLSLEKIQKLQQP
jgi:predicted transposase/invertase (TIGR01784 family)